MLLTSILVENFPPPVIHNKTGIFTNQVRCVVNIIPSDHNGESVYRWPRKTYYIPR